jgi:hypothetical protein
MTIAHFIPFAWRIRQLVKLIPFGLALVCIFASVPVQATVPSATTTTLAITSGGSAANSVASHNVVSLTATVMAGTTPVTTGQVNFCDATAAYCTDIHVLATVQLLKTGTATYKFIPSDGNHSYKAVFVGTTTFTPSSSSAEMLDVAVVNETTTKLTTTASQGNYSLTAAVTGMNAAAAPTGTVSFLDESNGGASLGEGTLVPGTTSFGFTESSLDTGKDPSSVVVGDFNGDGIQDLVVENEDDQTLSIFFGKGDGTFTLFQETSPLDIGFGSLFVADFNGDGNLDIVSGALVLLGNGDGTFVTKTLSITYDSVVSAVADFNGDGIPDLGVAGNSNYSAILLGNGDGSFTAVSTSSFPRETKAVGDFNGDGFPDLVEISYNGSVSILLGNGDGTFTTSIPLPQLSSTANTIVVADLNGDGNLDLVFGETNAVVAFLGDGKGNFTQTAQIEQTPSTGDQPEVMVIGDFNGDGIPDLVVMTTYGDNGACSSSSCFQLILMGKGDGTFNQSQSTPQDAVNPTAIGVGDFNSDGFTDVAVLDAGDYNDIFPGSCGGLCGDGRVTVSLSEPTEHISTATVSGTGITPGTGYHTVIAKYPGDNNYQPSSDTGYFVAPQGTPLVNVALSPNPSVYGSAVTITATVTGSGSTPTGYVYFYEGGALLGSATLNANAVATYTTSALAAGSHSITAYYGGDSDYVARTSSAISLTVNKATPVATLTPSTISTATGVPVTLSAVLTGGYVTPGGTVTFLDGANTLATATLSKGLASYIASSLGLGAHSLTVSYSGDANFIPTTSAAVTVTVSESITPTVKLTLSAPAITTAQSLTASLAVTGGAGNPTPTGSVTLSGGGYSSSSVVLSAGGASMTIPAGALAVGQDTLVATYVPGSASSSVYSSATQSATVTVTQVIGTIASTVTVIPASAAITNQQTLAVTATVVGASGSATPAGVVTLSSGSFTAQQSLSNGTANFNVPAGTLSNGTDSLIVTYAGDATFAASSGTATVTVSVVVVAAPPPSPVMPGGSTTSTATLTAGSSYHGTMNLTCSLKSSPSGAVSLPTCSVSPASVTIAAGGSGTTTFTVKTVAASSSAKLQPSHMNLWGLGGGTALAGLLMLWIPNRRRRWLSMALLLWVLGAAATIGCGGGGGTGKSVPAVDATTAGNYTFTLTGTDSANSAITTSTNVAVTVQ